jgi:hypothetical protein
VGGVDEDGNVVQKAYGDRTGNIISLYAPYYFECLDNTFTPASKGGTSGSAALTSGVLAEWLSMPAVVSVIKGRPERNFPAQVRGFLRDTSLTYNYPSGLNVLYNGFRDNACSYQVGTFDRKRDDSDSEEVPVIVNGTIVDTNYFSAVGTLLFGSSKRTLVLWWRTY